MTINNYLYIENGQIKQFEGVGKPPVRARLKDLRDIVIKCWEKSSQKHLAELGKQIDFINQKIDKHNANLTGGFFGWFFRLFTLDKIPPLNIQAAVKIGEMKNEKMTTKIQKELTPLVKNRGLTRCVLSPGGSPQEQTAITYNPDSNKVFLTAGTIGKVHILPAGTIGEVQWKDRQMSPEESIELKRGKNLIILPQPKVADEETRADKKIVIEIY